MSSLSASSARKRPPSREVDTPLVDVAGDGGDDDGAALSVQPCGYSCSSDPEPATLDSHYPTDITIKFEKKVCIIEYHEKSFTVFSYFSCQCINTHLERFKRCPVCNRNLDPNLGPIVFPNYTACSIVDAFRFKTELSRSLSAHGVNNMKKGEALVEMALFADINMLDHLMNFLKERRSRISSANSWKNNVLLMEFLDEMVEQREAQLAKIEKELAVLRRDKASLQVSLVEVVQKIKEFYMQ
ncbi:unnamed protein product [Gongylonema pulchrum]|uniref:RING-type domain-containing protein n=1 Tax=Gongylonema pulchrum TaxID=637853 RepID=A0A183E9S0_9BILA|nr:unnamed protein product [Gongylonema pulchrum]